MLHKLYLNITVKEKGKDGKEEQGDYSASEMMNEWKDWSLRSNLTKILAKYMSEPILKSRLDYKILILPTSRSKGALEATYALLNFARID